MKIEKVSFKNIKDILSRDEMKNIMAGCGGGNGACTNCAGAGGSVACGRNPLDNKCDCPTANPSWNNC
jgi:hypothetical protein